MWPESVAPYQVHVVDLRKKEEGKGKKDIAAELENVGIEVLWDDRENVSPGVKFADADLLGIPWRVVMSERLGDKVELKHRSSLESKIIDLREAVKVIKVKRLTGK